MTESIVPVTGSVISDPDAQAAIRFLGALSQVRVSDEPATRRAAGLRRAGPGRRPARHHDRGSTAPALEPGRALRSSTAVTAAPARPPQPTITKAVRGEVASSTGPPTR
jgi:hypothetical protein